MRSTTQWPGGGVQSSVPSVRIFDVRSTTSLLRIASAAGTAGVAISERPATAERRLLLEPVHERAGVQDELGDLVPVGGGGSGRSMLHRRGRRRGHERDAEEAGGHRREGDRVLRGRAAGDVDDRPELWPSSLASRSGPAGGGPNGHLNPAIVTDTPRIATGFGNSNWIHAFWPTGATAGRRLAKSPSVSSAGRTCRRSR